MNVRPWPALVALALVAASPLSAEQTGGEARSEGLRFVAPAEVEENFSASNPGPHDPRLLLALSHFDHGPAPEELAAFQPGLGEKLRAIVVDERVLQLARIRAVSALGTLAEVEAFDLVVALARDEAALPRLRIQALWTIGHRFEGRAGREPILAEALREPDHGLRLHAVLSLARIGTEEAMEIIDAHRIAERHVSVRSVLRELREARHPDIRLPDEGLVPARPRQAAPTVHGRDELRSPIRIEESNR